MKEEELIKELQSRMEGFNVLSIHHVNMTSGHLFTIGNKHIEAAHRKGRGGKLGEEVMREVDCYQCKGRFNYDQHYDGEKVLFVSLRRDLTNREAHSQLSGVKGLMEENKLEGWAFVETEEKWRIGEPDEEQLREAERMKENKLCDYAECDQTCEPVDSKFCAVHHYQD